jgi:hypothetical protein
LALKFPESGELISLDVIEGKDAAPASRKLLQTQSKTGGMSVWDSSGIFFEMHGLEIADKPSARTLVLLYAADLFFRLRWEIIPALEEGKCVIAAPYIETALAFGSVMGLPAKWLDEVFRFAPKSAQSFRLNGGVSGKIAGPTSGFIEFCSSTFGQDLRPRFVSYFEDLERRGLCRSL